MGVEIVKFIIYSLLIVAIAKYVLVKLLRKLGEALSLSPKTVGNVAGIATSVPELLTVCFSAFAGLISTSVYNIISSNIINTVQYSISLMINKNTKMLKNKAIAMDIILSIVTIIIPVIMVKVGMQLEINIIPMFVLLFVLFYFLNNVTHKNYLNEQDEKIEEEIQKEEELMMADKTKIIIKYSFFLVLTAVCLYIIGNALSTTLENLAGIFSIPEWLLGVALGFITSLPELITFFESQRHYKQNDNNELGVVEATNNLLTSNILNLYVIQSIGIVISAYFSKI